MYGPTSSQILFLVFIVVSVPLAIGIFIGWCIWA